MFVEPCGGGHRYLTRHELLDPLSAEIVAARYNRAYVTTLYDRLRAGDESAPGLLAEHGLPGVESAYEFTD
jgi:hypothetical protein